MAQASGIFKQIAIKQETTYGALPTASGAQLLRRVDAAFNLQKDTYESAELRTDLQTADMRHGVRSVAGNLNGELSPGSYAPYLGALLKRDFAVVSAQTGLSLTIASGTLNTWSITRAAGSYLTSGLKIGQVVRLTAGTFNAANLNKNLFIVDMTATVITVIVLNGTALVAEGPIATATISLPGKTTYIPISGHTDYSYSIEEWYNDIARSEVFAGCKFTKASIQLPPTGMATIAFDVAGKDYGQVPSASRYFTSPTAALASGVVASVNGVLRVGGVTLASVTGLNFDINADFSGDPVVGSNVKPSQFAGRVKVTGQFTAYFEDGTLPAAFVGETELAITVALTTSNDPVADFVTFTFSRVKLGGADKNDSEGGVVRTYPFTALLNNAAGAGTAYEQSTMAIQDSLA